MDITVKDAKRHGKRPKLLKNDKNFVTPLDKG